MISRRGLLGAIICAPAIIRTPGLLMPIKVLRPEPIIQEFVVVSVSEEDGLFHHTLEEYNRQIRAAFSLPQPFNVGERVNLKTYYPERYVEGDDGSWIDV